MRIYEGVSKKSSPKKNPQLSPKNSEKNQTLKLKDKDMLATTDHRLSIQA